MSWLFNLVAKIGGIGKLWGFLDGYKTKIAGVGALLSGIAGIVAQVVSLIEAKDASSAWEFVTSLPSNQAWMMLLGGLGAIGIGHKMDKAVETVTPAK